MGLVDEGLSYDGGVREAPAEPEVDINTDAGYSARLAAKVGKPLSPEQVADLEQGERSIESGLTTGERQRDEQGRFTAETPATEPVATEPQEDPWEKRYNELNELFGRHTAEVGETRQENQQLRERLARLEGQVEASSGGFGTEFMPFLDPDELVMNMGGEAAAGWVLNNVPGAYENGMYDRVIESWSEDPEQEVRARTFDRHFQREMMKAELLQEARGTAAPEPATPANNPEIQALIQQQRMEQTIGQLQQKIGSEEWGVVKDHLIPLLEEESTPLFVKQAVASEDAATRLQGFEALTQMAKGRALTTAASTAQAEQQANVEAAKRAALVASGAARPANADTPTNQMTKEEFEALPPAERKALASQIMRDRLNRPEHSTSVADGLTWGKSSR